MFMITGPGSPNVLTNVVCAIEQHVDWVAEAIAHFEEHDVQTVEADETAQTEWTETCAEMAAYTLYPEGGNSWYTGANIPRQAQGDDVVRGRPGRLPPHL